MSYGKKVCLFQGCDSDIVASVWVHTERRNLFLCCGAE